MGTLKLDRLPGYLHAPDSAVRVFLVYGPDAGRVRETSCSIVVGLAGSDDDPFAVTKLAEADIVGDPGCLADEANAIAFGGGSRVVWVKDAGSAVAKALAALLAGGTIDGTVVVEAASLGKTSPLRLLVEKSDRGLAIACYEAEGRDLTVIIADMAKSEGFEIGADAMEFLRTRLGGDRTQIRSEMAKLVTYCHGHSVITLEDADAICSDGQTGTIERLIDAAMEGQTAAAVRDIDELNEAGVHPTVLLSAMGGHVGMLRSLHAASGGASADQIVQSARPPIFFKRKPSMSRQLRLWPSDRLEGASKTIYEAILQTRRFSGLDRVIAERAILALALRAARMRFS